MIIRIITIIIRICVVKLRNFCNMFRAFLQRFRGFLQHTRHFCNIAYDLVLQWAIFPSTTSSRIRDNEEVQCKSNRLAILYFITTKNDCYTKAACFVGKCSFCLDIVSVTSLKTNYVAKSYNINNNNKLVISKAIK